MLKKILFILLLFPFVAISQQVKGIVLSNENNAPLYGVNVYLNNPKIGTVTNQKGKFSLEIGKKHQHTDSLYISHLGYQTKKIPLSEIPRGRFKLYLIASEEKLGEVKISSKIKLQPRLKFEKLANMKKSLFAFGSEIINGKIYVLGGDFSVQKDASLEVFKMDPTMIGPNFNFSLFLTKARLSAGNWKSYSGELMIYDIQQNIWKKSNVAFRKRAYHNVHFYNNQLYALGGKQLSPGRKYEYLDPKIEMFDLQKNSVSIDDTNPHRAVDFASFLYKNYLIVMGGSIKMKKNKKKIYTNKVHSYNLETGLWYELPNLPFTNEIKGTLIGDTIYVLETSDNHNKASKLHCFDLISGKWRSIGELPKGIKHPALTSDNSIIYLLENGKLYTFDTLSHTFNEYLINLYLNGASMHCYEDKLLVLGGYQEDSISKLPSSGLYSIDLDQIDKTRINMFAQM